MTVEPRDKVEKPVQLEKHVIVQEQQPASPQPGKPARRWWIAVLAFVIVVAIVISGILPRINARAALEKETAEMSIPTVSVITPKRGAPTREVVLPANVQAYIDSPIYARTNGYLKRWYTDIGARVKAGQLIAEIETPEVDQQLRQSRADLATAEANLNLSQITATRYEDLLKTDSVSKQDTDNAIGRPGGQTGHGAILASQREAVGRAAIVREDLCALRRGDHGAEYGYRRIDRLGEQRWGED